MTFSHLIFRSISKSIIANSSRKFLYASPKYSMNHRFFSTAQKKVLKALNSELQHESSNFEKSDTIQNFLKKNQQWNYIEKDGDTNMTLKKNLGNDKNMTVEFQLVSPFQADEESESQSEMTDFSVTIENQKGNGMTFYCSTLQNDEKFRYMIGNVRYFHNEDQRNSVSSFNGPDFEDLDDAVQESLDEWLNSMGVDDELCDFIDACSVEKEQKEYMNWLKNVTNFVE